MTQRNRAEYILDRINLPEERQLKDLQAILDEAQNGPPLGEADGSINEEAWRCLSSALNSFQSAITNLKTFRRSIS